MMVSRRTWICFVGWCCVLVCWCVGVVCWCGGVLGLISYMVVVVYWIHARPFPLLTCCCCV